MANKIVYAGIGTAVGVVSGNILLTEPVGTMQDDVVVAIIGGRGSNPWSLPIGWTEITQDNSGNTSVGGRVSFVVAYTVRGNLPPDYTFARTATTNHVSYGNTIALRSANLASPVHAFQSQSYSTSTSTPRIPNPGSVPNGIDGGGYNPFLVVAAIGAPNISQILPTFSNFAFEWQIPPSYTPPYNESNIVEQFDGKFNTHPKVGLAIATMPAYYPTEIALNVDLSNFTNVSAQASLVAKHGFVAVCFRPIL